MRRFAPVLASVLLACAHGASGSSPVSLRSETVQEDKAELAFDLSYEVKGPRKVELVLKMRVIGIQETNKLVAELYIKGFNVDSGNTRWDGFVPPRQPQTFRVALSVPDGFDTATATISLTRSQDSLPLMREELIFAIDDKGAVTKQ